MGIRECQRVFGEARGGQICELIEAATEQACPCKAGQPCPLLSGALVALTLSAVGGVSLVGAD